MKGFAQFTLTALVATVSAVSVDLNKRESPLSVVLASSGNTEVKVAVKNNGDRTLNLLQKGTFLDEVNPVQRLNIYADKGSTKVPFEGIRIRLLTTGLSADDFLTLGAGQTKEVTVETASLHTLNDGGDFDVFAKGLLPYAEANSTELSGTLDYESNKLVMTVNGAAAANVTKRMTKRTSGGSACSSDQITTLRTALTNCYKQACAAADAACQGTKLDTYFKSTSASTQKTVADRLRAVAGDCGGGKSVTTTACDDTYNGCSASVLAYTVPEKNHITYCPVFFSELPPLADECHGQDQATTILHETTHATGVYSPGTEDYGYGFAAATALSADRALMNADTYALYANSIALKCDDSKSGGYGYSG